MLIPGVGGTKSETNVYTIIGSLAHKSQKSCNGLISPLNLYVKVLIPSMVVFEDGTF